MVQIDAIAPMSAFLQAHKDSLININKNNDPSVPYANFDYSKSATYKREWNTVTINARGLIVNTETHEIVARPFPKFFNYGQDVEGYTDTINLSGPVVVSDKVDGSMGILYTLPDGRPAIATRGSMNSEQAQHATALYRERYEGKWTPMAGVTYVFEIIYPENRIVLDYGHMDDLVLLGAVNIETGRSIPLPDVAGDWVGPVAEVYTFSSFEEVLLQDIPANKEGFVVHFIDSDDRLKVKGEDYMRMHAIMTNVTALDIWRHLSEGGTVASFINSDDVPDEYYNKIDAYADSLLDEHARIMAEGARIADEASQIVVEKNLDRKDTFHMITELCGDEYPYLGKHVMRVVVSADDTHVERAFNGMSSAVWVTLRPFGTNVL